MAFDYKGFEQARLVPRSKKIPVEELAEWFCDGPAVWEVRGLTANEIARANEAEVNNRRVSAITEAIASGSRKDIVEEIRAATGKTTETRPDLARRLSLLELGSVEPQCSEEMAVKLGQSFPTQFYLLTNTILELTGQGADVRKK
jgi:hypothetical protein